MKKTLMSSLILLGLFNNISSMEESNNKIKEEAREEERNLGNLEALPSEIRYEIVKFIIEDNINSWDNIFDFDNKFLKNDLDRVRLISKDFTVFGKGELKNLIKKLKDEKFEHLKEKIKDQYKGSSKEELNQKLINLLNAIYLRSPTENLKECVGLIIAGANINAQDNDGWTALILAAWNGHIEVVKLLIKMGANIDITNNNRWTALMLAAWNSHIEVARLLIEKGAKIDSIDNSGWTALMLAAWNGYAKVVRLLIDNGADINVKDNVGWTALMIVAKDARIGIVRLLIAMGADINIANNAGNTALTLAQERGHKEIVELLKSSTTSCNLQ